MCSKHDLYSHDILITRLRLIRHYSQLCRKLAEEGAGQVFMSDTVLTTLMCAPRSVYSWDILVTKADGKLYFDTRDGYSLATLTVSSFRV